MSKKLQTDGKGDTSSYFKLSEFLYESLVQKYGFPNVAEKKFK
jgi:hypothetical protein